MTQNQLPSPPSLSTSTCHRFEQSIWFDNDLCTFGPFAINQKFEIKQQQMKHLFLRKGLQCYRWVNWVVLLFLFTEPNSNNLQPSMCDEITIGIGIGPKSGGHWECPHPIWTSQISRHVSFYLLYLINIFTRMLVSTVHLPLKPNVHVKGQFRIL